MPETAVWVLVAAAVYVLGVAIYFVCYWPWSRSQRALGRLRRVGAPVRSMRRSEARILQLIEFPAGAPVLLLEGHCAEFVIRSAGFPPRHVHTLAGVPVKYPAGLQHAVRAGNNTAEVVLGREYAMIVRLNGATLTSHHRPSSTVWG
ncbi:hypothetical protein K5K93_08390 [Stenotrophomonas sp. DR822]|uniref:hypothetical protein n=1 Tax=Stenotrophomonas sp. DR822 TaxID=2871174 RepID=UPI001C976F9E|nr:hypothetical protein [Stenotrophomonas sp. DR822]QZN82399.1 hypothetical protein K5K93_08390 [Stenotrophomonas sp. DR822]